MSMPPPPPPPPPPSSMPPPGYVPYGGAPRGRLQPSRGLSKAMVVLYWCTTAATALLAVALFHRKSTWDDFLAGRASFDDLDSADGAAGGMVLLQVALVLASAIVTCLWAKRIADNATARGVTGVSPGLAAGGWFIPIGNYFVPWNELRKSVTGVGGRSSSLAVWQALFVVSTVLYVGIRSFGNFDVFDPDGVSDRLRNQSLVGALGALVYLGASVFAMRAAKEIDAAVSEAA